MLPLINNGIQQCCIEKRCINNFQGIPMRVFDRNAIPYHHFLFDKEEFCSTCGFPENTPAIIEQLEDLQEDSANEASDLGFDAVYPGNHGNCRFIQTFWQRRHRLNSRRGGHIVRRNLLNIIIYIPTKNCYLVIHQTYRYLPFHMDPDILLDRILREMMALMREDLLQDIPDFFCKC